MASLISDPNGRKRIQFTGRDKARRTLRLGKCSQRQAEAIKVRVEQLVLTSTGAANVVDADTVTWLSALDDAMYGKLAAVGLVDPREGDRKTTLGPFIQNYIDSRVDLKHRTKWMLRQAQRSLIAYFGADKALRDINEADAELWRLSMVQEGLADATIRKRCQHAKQFLARAMKAKLVDMNPFAPLPSSSKPNPERMVFVSQADIEKVIACCPDVQWKLIFALARYGGLRCPSEVLSLQWQDINWEAGRMLVRSVKTEHHEGKESRLVPIFGELRPYLLAAFEEAEPGDTYCITRYRQDNANLRTQAHRIIRRAGLKPWPRTFQNLRSSRETELTETFPLHVVTAWIGNSALIASKHYLQVTDEHFERAIQDMRKPELTTPEAAQNPTHIMHATQNPTSPTAASCRHTPQENRTGAPENDDRRLLAICGDTLRESPIAPRGFEPLSPG